MSNLAACDVALTYMLYTYYNIKLAQISGLYGLQPYQYKDIVDDPASFHFLLPHEILKLRENQKQGQYTL